MLQPSHPYNMLKFSLQLFRRSPNELESIEYEAVKTRADAECALQLKVLSSKEGMNVVVPQISIEEALAAITARYESAEAFKNDLLANDMDPIAMASALEVDLTVEATMAQVAAQAAPPSETEVMEILQTSNTTKPEKRRLRHILVTINDQFPENSRQAALSRITTLRDKALAPGKDFSELAQRYSECPSALQGGSINPVARGGIHPCLEETLFSMEEGEISKIVESNMGFHILLCEEKLKTEKLLPKEAKVKIRKSMHAQIKKKAVQTWLSNL